MIFLNLGGDVPNLPLAQHFYKNEMGFKMEVWYKSIYGDKWKLTYVVEGNSIYEEVDKNFSLPYEEQFEN